MATIGKGKGSKIFLAILLGLLILGLAGFGIGDFGGSVRSVGAVGDEEIPVQEYARALNTQLQELQNQTGERLSMTEARQMGLDRMVLGQLLRTAALDNEARRLGLSVGDGHVRERLIAIPAFQGIDGSFDRTSYEFALQQVGVTPAEFDEELRDDATRNLLADAITSATEPGDTYTRTLLNFIGERRDFTWARLGADALEGPAPEPTEAELAEYHDANPELFTTPESRDITYVWLTPDMLIDSIEVDETQLRALYEERADRYSRPARRLVERLVFGTTEAAAAARAQIDTGETSFDDLVAERGLTLDEVDMGEVTREDLSAEAAEQVFGLLGPGVAGPVQSSLGPALFRVNALLEAQKVPFAQAEADLRDEFSSDRARRIIDDSVDRIDDLLAGGATLEEIAAETEMRLAQIDFNAETDGHIAAYDAFRDAAGAVQEGDFPELGELSDGGIFALRLDGITPARLQPLDEVRAAVEAAWREDENLARLADMAEEKLPALEDGESFRELGLEPQSDTDLTRNAFIDGAPRGLLETVFRLETGGVAMVEGERAVFVARLDAVTPPDMDDPDMQALRESLRSRQQSGMEDDLFEGFASAVQQNAGVELNQTAINAVHTQYP
ncbi:peptidylprolyl isomerase [Maritimibacter sp. 55A14]|uniref:SurA N-terminal domain-containing protein n=1 Tax=Maritimibacter sp. 55A14 TaxID=2174844 RepID=UPI000D612D9A|nr:SurA N-terminal domain-containing protein [Maritimibacter sp. 55A14]PWE34272.1 peptidylprolyl isomerase [Maritimibacter sp. 55A14]